MQGGDRFEPGGLRLPVQKDASIGTGESAGIGFADLYQLIWFRVRQGLQQQGVDEAEDGGVGADAESEGEDGDSGEAGRLEKLAEGVAEVGEHGRVADG